MVKKLSKFISLKIENELKRKEILMKQANDIDAKKQWDLETGRKFNELITQYPMSEAELLRIAEMACKMSLRENPYT